MGSADSSQTPAKAAPGLFHQRQDLGPKVLDAEPVVVMGCPWGLCHRTVSPPRQEWPG